MFENKNPSSDDADISMYVIYIIPKNHLKSPNFEQLELANRLTTVKNV